MALRLPGFGERVKAIIDSAVATRRITQGELAQEWRVEPSNLSNWKAGTLPNDYAMLKKLAEHGGLTIAYLLVGDEAKEKYTASTAEASRGEDAGRLLSRPQSPVSAGESPSATKPIGENGGRPVPEKKRPRRRKRTA